MCNCTITAPVATAVQKIVAIMVASAKMFTAWNVTVEARKQGIKASHREWKHAVRDVFNAGGMPGYSSKVIDLNGLQPILYYPKNADITKYDGAVIDAGDTVSVHHYAPKSVVSLNLLRAAVMGNLDCDGRLCVPIGMVRNVAVIGSHVYVSDNGNGGLTLSARNNGSYYARYTVNSDGRVRISPSVLKNVSNSRKGYSISYDATSKTINVVGA